MYFLPEVPLRTELYRAILGAAKRYARENCDYSWSGLQRVVPAALESVDTITIRRFARKAWRYMDLYRKGITGKLAEYAQCCFCNKIFVVLRMIIRQTRISAH